MTATNCLVVVALGLVLGAVGQAIRAIVGLKKRNDSGAELSPGRLFVSLMIGAVAGALAAITLLFSNTISIANLSSQTLFALMGAGYAGADFIEGFMNKNGVPVSQISQAQQSSADPQR